MRFIAEITGRFSKIRVVPGMISFQYKSSEYHITEIRSDCVYYGNGHRLSDKSFKIASILVKRKISGSKVVFILADN